MKMKILHIAPFNIANVPLTLVLAERNLGHESRLITFARHPRGFPEDICLDLPLVHFKGLTWLKRLVAGKSRIAVSNIKPQLAHLPPIWRPTPLEKLLIKFREALWQPRVKQAVERYRLDQFDVIQLDGGVGFFRDGRDIVRWKKMGKKIICCYAGSDLRVRGVIPPIDAIADVNVTVEFDHLQLHPKIHHVMFPFDASRFEPLPHRAEKILRIGHAPTNRAAKGSDVIIPVVQELEKEFPVQLILIENLPYQKAIQRKAQCHIFIDQIGDLGYGINSLEALAMGIPTCTCLAPGFEQHYPDHPFIVIDAENLKQRLIDVIQDKALRRIKARQGLHWVKQYHDPMRVVQTIHDLAKL
jgi:glycosyltransferase involved in cell wall biosynthesis